MVTETAPTVKKIAQTFAKIWEADEKTQAFLDFLHRGGKERFFQAFMPDGTKNSEWRQVGKAIVLPKYVENATSLFFCVNPASTRVTDEDREHYPNKADKWIEKHVGPKNRTIQGSNTLIAEFDGKDETNPTEEDIAAIYTSMRADPENAKVADRVLMRQAAGQAKKAKYLTDPEKYRAMARARIKTLPVLPSVIVDSGGGYHCYWLLRETFVISNDADLDWLKSVYARWVAFNGADPESKDVRRLLRVPGAYNRKPAYAPDFPLVRFVKYDLDQVYDLAELVAMLPAEEPKTPAVDRSKLKIGGAGDDEKPLDVFNRENEIGTVLEAYGYTWFSRDRMSRPGDEHSGGVIIDRKSNRSQHWSSNDELVSEYWRRPSHVLIQCEYKGDIEQAVRKLGKAQREANKDKKPTPVKKQDTVAVIENPFEDAPPEGDPYAGAQWEQPTTEAAIEIIDDTVTYAEIMAEIEALPADKFALMQYLLLHAGRCARLPIMDGARLRVELQKRKIAKSFMDGDWAEAMANATVKALPAKKKDDAPKAKKHPYSLHEGCIGRWQKRTDPDTGEEENVFEPLCNFNAWIVADVAADDGEEIARKIVLAGMLANGAPLQEIEIRAEDFEPMKWPVAEWGARVSIVPNIRNAPQLLRHAIQALSAERMVDRRTYTHTGWRVIEGKRVFLHNGGAVGMEGVHVKLDGNLKYYSLPGDELVSVKEAMRASVDLLDMGPARVTAPIWASMYAAVLSEFNPPVFMPAVTGGSGSLKSSACAVFLNHFGPKFTESLMPSDFLATANRIEKEAFHLKDVPLIVDDLRPSTSIVESRSLQETVSRIARAAGNRQGRGRLDSNSEFKRSYAPRGLVMMTAERGAAGKSTNSRIMTIDVEPNDISSGLLSVAQKQRHVYGYAMKGFIESVARDWDELTVQLPARVVELRTEGGDSNHHRRLPNATAILFSAFEAAMTFALDVGAIDADEFERRCDECKEALHLIEELQSQATEAEDPAIKYISILATLIAQNRGHLDGRGRVAPLGTLDSEKLGWYDPSGVYLLSGAYNTVCRYALNEGWSFPSDEITLRKELDRKGWLAKKDKDHTTTRQRDPESSRLIYVTAVSYSMFYKALEDVGYDFKIVGSQHETA